MPPNNPGTKRPRRMERRDCSAISMTYFDELCPDDFIQADSYATRALKKISNVIIAHKVIRDRNILPNNEEGRLGT